MKRHHDLTTPNGGLGSNCRVQSLNGVRLLKHTSLRIARIVDFRDITNHLIHQGTLIGVMSHLGVQLEPLTTGRLHGNPVHCNRCPFNGVVANVLNPLKLKPRITRSRSTSRILQRRPNIRQIEDKLAIVKEIRHTTHLTTERRRRADQWKLKG
jgi:hypothetical protein